MHFDSEFEQKLYQQRQEKLVQIKALGCGAYPNSFESRAASWTEFERPYHHVDQETLRFAGSASDRRTTGGRAQTGGHRGPHHGDTDSGQGGIRSGAAGGERLQIYVRKDDVGENAFALYASCSTSATTLAFAAT